MDRQLCSHDHTYASRQDERTTLRQEDPEKVSNINSVGNYEVPPTLTPVNVGPTIEWGNTPPVLFRNDDPNTDRRQNEPSRTQSRQNVTPIPSQIGGSGRYRINVPHFEIRPNAQSDPATLQRARDHTPMEQDQPEEPQPMECDDAPQNLLPIDQLYELGQPEQQHVRRFNTTASTYPLHFRNIDQANNYYDQLPAIFDHAIDRIIEGAFETDYIGAELIHPDLHAPVLIPFQHPGEIQGSQLLHVLQRVLQSNEHLNLNDNQLKVRIVKVSPPAGKGYHSRQCTNPQ